MRGKLMVTIMGLMAVMAVATAPASAAPQSFPVFFQPWSAAIDNTASTTIEAAARAALASPKSEVTIEGAADTVGGSLANEYMAKTRAYVVADALAADGIPASRLKVAARGASGAPGVPTGHYAQFSRRVLIRIGN